VTGLGHVTASPTGTETTTGVYQFTNEEQVVLTALGDVGNEFVGWQGDSSGTELTSKLLMSSNHTVKAVFAAIPGPVSASASIQAKQGEKSVGLAPTIFAAGNQDFLIKIVSQPAHGIATVSAGLLFYQSQPDYVGADSFSFQVTNSRGVSLQVAAVADVQVNAINHVPSSADLQITTSSNQASSPVAAVVNDPDTGDGFSFSIIAQPAHGSVVLQIDRFVYTPDNNFTGDDSFTYSVTDTAGNTLTALAKVSVSPATTPGNGAGNNTSNGSSSGGMLGLMDLLSVWYLLLLFRKKRK
jgi:hypothetical protein